MKLTNQQEMVLKYNWWVMKCNQLEEGVKDPLLLEFLPRNYEGELTQDDIKSIINQFYTLDERYKELKIGKYAE